MRVVLTGGAGFVGSHIAEAFVVRGDDVVIVDNLLTGNAENLREIRDSVTLLERDVSTGVEVSGPVDAVLHFASPASPPDYHAFPIATLDVGTAGTRTMLRLAAEKRARFLLASTSEIYGDPLEHPQRESYWGNVNPNGPRSCYDESKRFGEALCAQHVRSYGLDARIVRIFNTYGPHSRIDDGRVVPNFVGQALRGEPITVYGDGSQTRSFCYVSDLVAGLQAVMFAPGKQGDVFNLGNPREQTIREFAETVVQICGELAGSGGATPHIAWRDLPVDDPTRRRPDITKARGELGWEPRVPLEVGLRETIAWFLPRVGREEPAAIEAGSR